MDEPQRREWPHLHSFDEMQTVLRRAYATGGFELPANVTPGSAVAADFEHDLRAQKFGALFCLLDEMTALLRFLSTGLLITAATAKEKGAAEANEAAVFHRVCVKSVANLASIRTLCLIGFDGNARIQLRLHYETMVLWSRLRIDPAALEAFATSLSPEDANRFWREYVAFQKCEKFIATAVGRSEGKWPGFAGDFQDHVGPILGASAHPSNIEMMAGARDDWAGVQDRCILRDVSDASLFTLSSAIWMCPFPFMIGELRLHEVNVPPAWNPPEDSVIRCADKSTNYYGAIQKMILLLFIVAQPFIGGLRREMKLDPAPTGLHV